MGSDRCCWQRSPWRRRPPAADDAAPRWTVELLGTTLGDVTNRHVVMGGGTVGVGYRILGGTSILVDAGGYGFSEGRVDGGAVGITVGLRQHLFDWGRFGLDADVSGGILGADRRAAVQRHPLQRDDRVRAGRHLPPAGQLLPDRRRAVLPPVQRRPAGHARPQPERERHPGRVRGGVAVLRQTPSVRLAAVPKGRFSTVEERPFGTAAKRVARQGRSAAANSSASDTYAAANVGDGGLGSVTSIGWP